MPGVAERAAKSADLISTIQMLVDMVGAASVGDGGRRECGTSNRPSKCTGAVLDKVHGHSGHQRRLLRHIYAFEWRSLIYVHSLVSHCAARALKQSPPNFQWPPYISSPPSLVPQIDSGYRIAHIADGGRASHGQLSSDLPSFDEIRSANLKYDLADAALYKVGSVGSSLGYRWCGTVWCSLGR